MNWSSRGHGLFAEDEMLLHGERIDLSNSACQLRLDVIMKQFENERHSACHDSLHSYALGPEQEMQSIVVLESHSSLS